MSTGFGTHQGMYKRCGGQSLALYLHATTAHSHLSRHLPRPDCDLPQHAQSRSLNGAPETQLLGVTSHNINFWEPKDFEGGKTEVWQSSVHAIVALKHKGGTNFALALERALTFREVGGDMDATCFRHGVLLVAPRSAGVIQLTLLRVQVLTGIAPSKTLLTSSQHSLYISHGEHHNGSTCPKDGVLRTKESEVLDCQHTVDAREGYHDKEMDWVYLDDDSNGDAVDVAGVIP
ncbi:hypothetical protein BV22DRAFT_1121000 [Leucogyrophana mollusca]|uniref:Uncharacterized protein n=1 Tax=Leucogyrophana mollusca TaxID=85980 RepID=A0ACB8BEH3_9AGAM|nr:hypothetical protein BV22DRAFT_1121000 [Leucogyrophana mollusca]